MKNRIRYLIVIGFLAPFIFISCKSTGTTVPDSLTDSVPDLSGPADEASLAALAQARAVAEESRALAEYVNGESYCPDEWSAAEERYAAAGSETDDPEEKAEAYARTAEWRAIGGLYDAIYLQSAPRFAGEQEKVLSDARNRAVEAGAQELVPDRLALADQMAASSRQKMSAADINGSIKDGKAARDRYRVLETLAAAHTKQQEADENDFFSRDSNNYMLAADAGNEAVDLFDTGDIARSQDKADEALLRFNQVVKNGWVSLVEEKAFDAQEQRTAAREAKADVAVRQDFNAAEQIYNRAHTALRAGEYQSAANLFDQSSEGYLTARDNAIEKRERAEAALRQAEQKLAASEEKAQSVEEIIGGE